MCKKTSQKMSSKRQKLLFVIFAPQKGQKMRHLEKMNIFSIKFIFIRFYFVKGLRQKIMQFSQVCAKVRKLRISNIFQKYSWQGVFHRQDFPPWLQKALICLEKVDFYTVTTRFSTAYGENRKKASRILSDVQIAQKSLWKTFSAVLFFRFLFDIAVYMWYNYVEKIYSSWKE
jgi:hypothetical protein